MEATVPTAQARTRPVEFLARKSVRHRLWLAGVGTVIGAGGTTQPSMREDAPSAVTRSSRSTPSWAKRNVYAVVEAPSPLGLQTDGVARLPQALLACGLAEQLAARHAGRVEPPPREPYPDPRTGVRNARGVAAYATQLAHAADGTSPSSDLNAAADYRQHLARVLTRRAVVAAAVQTSLRAVAYASASELLSSARAESVGVGPTRKRRRSRMVKMNCAGIRRR